jgi:hypothetical protein
MSHIRKCDLSLLKLLSEVRPAVRKQLLNKLGDRITKLIIECVFNILHNKHIELSKNTKLKLRKYKSCLRQLATKNTSLKNKKKVIFQKGSGILPILVPPLLQFFSTLFSK